MVGDILQALINILILTSHLIVSLQVADPGQGVLRHMLAYQS